MHEQIILLQLQQHNFFLGEITQFISAPILKEPLINFYYNINCERKFS